MSRSSRLTGLAIALGALGVAAPAPAGAAATCPISYGLHDDAKPNKLYLYFPTADDATFPEFSLGGVPTSPAAPSTRPTSPPTPARPPPLRNARQRRRRRRLLRVQRAGALDDDRAAARRSRGATPSRSAPTPAAPASTGQAERVDTGDGTHVDFARVWAGTYQEDEGGPGGALNGVELDAGALGALDRRHRRPRGRAQLRPLARRRRDSSGPARTPSPATSCPPAATSRGEQRAGYRRHFSDTDVLDAGRPTSACRSRPCTTGTWSTRTPRPRAGSGWSS